MKQLSVEVSKWCPYVGVSLYRLHVPNAFGRRAGFDMDAKSGLSLGCARASTLMRGCMEMEWVELELGVK